MGKRLRKYKARRRKQTWMTRTRTGKPVIARAKVQTWDFSRLSGSRKPKINVKARVNNPKKRVKTPIPSDLAEIQAKARARRFINQLEVISGKKTEEEFKREDKILSEGLSAIASLAEEAEAIRSPKKFSEFAERKNITLLHRDHVDDEIELHGKKFVLYANRKQTGYSARHIGSIIEGLKRKDSQVVVIDLPRNRRKVFGEKSKLERLVEK
jgi:hypothetical protein